MTTSERTRPHLVPPDLAARLPSLRTSAGLAVAIGAASAVAVIAQALALAEVISRALLHHASLRAVTPGLIVVAVAIAGRALLTTAGDAAAQRTGQTVVATLRAQLVRHTLDLGPSWLSGERPGELSLTVTRGLRSLHDYFARYLPQAATAAVVPALLLIWVASQDWLSLVVVVVLVLAVPLTMIYFGRQATERAARQWRRLASLAGRFLQLVEGLPTLRAFGREGQGRREVEAATEGVRAATIRTLRVAFLSALAMDLIAGFGVGFVAMVLGLRLLWGELSLQTAMAVLLVAPDIFIPLRRAGAEFHASTEGQAAAARVLDVLDTPVPGAATRPATSTPTTWRPTTTNAAPLRITDLSIDYEQRDHPALEHFSLDVAPQQRVALVGPSGAGKSSVLAALLRFVEPTGGTMQLGDLDAAATDPGTWRAHFAWLPQRPYLFSATLAENLRLGAPDAPETDLAAVLEAVGLSPLVAHWPGGLATSLGQGGLSVSAGERQRIALARALLSPAPILLLDEPTAALDADSAAALARAIEPWLAHRTVLVAAHDTVLLPRFDAVHRLVSPTQATP